MQYAVRTGDGTWTGAVYDALTPAISAHHAAFGDEVLPISALTPREDGGWDAVPASAAEIAAQTTITRFQARAALIQAGLLDAVEAAVAGANDPLVQLAWAEVIEFPRSSPTIAALADILGLTADRVDQLFITAAQISA